MKTKQSSIEKEIFQDDQTVYMWFHTAHPAGPVGQMCTVEGCNR